MEKKSTFIALGFLNTKGKNKRGQIFIFSMKEYMSITLNH